MKLKKYAQLDKQLLNLVLFIAAIALGVGLLYQHNQKQSFDLSQLSATVLSKPRVVANFSLTDNTGNPFDNKSLLGHWSMMFFGFTNCPQLCPTTMAELNKMYQLLERDHLSEMPIVTMVSIDPKRDTQQKLNDYVTQFNANFKGAYGNQEQIDALSKQLGVVYMRTQDKKNQNYNINHSGAVMLFNPYGQLVAFFTVPHNAKSIANEYELIQQHR